MSEIKLSPPWYILRNQVANTIGLNEGVIVEELNEIEEGYELAILIKECDKARVIRAIMPKSYNFGNIKVIVNVYLDTNTCGNLIVPYSEEPYSSTEELSKIWCKALENNPLYLGMYLTEGKLPPIAVETVGQIVLIIDKKIVQFFNDDIGELCQNYNEVASKVFDAVCRKKFSEELKVSFATYDPNKIDFAELECR